jgi:hypothetical protein
MEEKEELDDEREEDVETDEERFYACAECQGKIDPCEWTQCNSCSASFCLTCSRWWDDGEDYCYSCREGGEEEEDDGGRRRRKRKMMKIILKKK